MRYISDDNKVFNTIEECQAHEKKLKDQEKQKKLAAERDKVFDDLGRRYKKITSLMEDWIDDYFEAEDKYKDVEDVPATNSDAKSNKNNKKEFDFEFLNNFLQDFDFFKN